MTTTSTATKNVDHFFSSSAARMDRWRELNAKAQAWAADARGNKSIAADALQIGFKALGTRMRQLGIHEP
jgi:arginine decarboxylase